MKGYIGVTSREWFQYLSNTSNIEEVNFWRKNTDNFKVLSKGELFFFLVKNEKGVSGERAVLGMATFERFEKLTVNDAWLRYRNANGDNDRESFVARMNSMFETSENNGELGCIILSDMRVFDHPVYLNEINIEFKNSVVSGKGISEKQINEIIDYGFANTRNIVKRLNEAESIGYTDDDEGFPEGKQVLKLHLRRERNAEVIKLAKERFLKRYGKVFCQVCGFDFKAHYGDLGDGYVEAHHTKPVSEMNENELTSIEDLALVCANCHRMLHRKRPWLSISQLKNVLINN